ncbi:MAG: nucleotidyltransferase family protein [Endomicrobia bacterium]|nr:nucleotidyltransferase family protein [Endomicrobiia bacterium]
METKSYIIETIRKNKKYIKTKYGVKKIGLFGSYVKSKQTKKSDIDILVSFKERFKTFDNYMELKFYLEDLFGRKVDLIIETAVKPRVLPYVLNEVIYV